MTTVLYLEVTRAAEETANKILGQRRGANGAPLTLRVTALGGPTASVIVNGGIVTLNLPSLPADTLLARHEADRMVGYIAHECLHVLHTDWTAWERAVQAGARVRLWTNALEDVRIEAKEIKAGAFPALRGLLAGLMDHTHYRSVVSAPRAIGSEVSDAPYCAAVLGRIANKYDIPTARNLRGDLCPQAVTLIDVALTGLKSCRSTLDVLGLARRLVAMEQAQAPAPTPTPPPPPAPTPQDDQGAQGDQGEAGDDQGAQGDQGEAGDDQGAQGAQGEAGDDQGAQGDQDGGAGHGDPNAPGADKNLNLDPGANLDDLVAAVVTRTGKKPADAGRDQGLHGYRNEWPTVPHRLDPAGLAAGGVAVFNRALPGRAILHGQISRLLVSPERTWTTHRETAGRLDRRALARLGTGAPDVFSQRHYRAGMDTAVSVLIDLSGSMSQRLPTAVVAAFHIAAAAEDAGASVGVYAFETPPASFANPGGPATARIVTVIPPGASVRGAANRLMDLRTGMRTPLSPAILGVAERLSEVSAARRILLVITDGDCDYGNKRVSEACNVAAIWGVETVGIGISAPAVINSFPNGYSVNVNDLDQLGQTGLGVLAAMLEDDAAA